MQIDEITRFEPAQLAELNALLPQLSRSAPPLLETELRAIVESDATHLLVACEDDRILGMLSLVVFRIPTGVRAWIEDVVVDEAHRGRGIAQALLEAAIALARSFGAKTLDLTSRPGREAANRLYRRVGFEQRETNVYRLGKA
jgi:ribosomal protein S18 acetylase RimI-like enzyme